MTTIEKDKENLVGIKKRYESDYVISNQSIEWLIETLDIYICRYERLQKAASESVGNAHITNTRLKRVMVDDSN